MIVTIGRFTCFMNTLLKGGRFAVHMGNQPSWIRALNTGRLFWIIS